MGAIIALVDQIAPGILSTLAPAEHATFQISRAALRTALDMWQNPSHPGLAYRLRPMAELGHRSAVQAIRSILATLPDESPAHALIDLAFLADAEFEASLRLDISTATTAVGNSEFKAAAVMAGSVMEAILLWALRRRPAAQYQTAYAAWAAARAVAGQPPPYPLDADILKWTLDQYIGIAGHIPIIAPATADALATSRGFRNLIHPGRAERLRERPSLGSALVATGSMRLLIDDIRERVAAGTL